MFVPDLTAMWRHGSSDTDASASLSLRVASCPSSKLIASTEHWKHGPNLLKIMRGTTMLRLCAHVVCLRFGRTSCKRTSATQIWKLLGKHWVFVESSAKHTSPSLVAASADGSATVPCAASATPPTDLVPASSLPSLPFFFLQCR